MCGMSFDSISSDWSWRDSSAAASSFPSTVSVSVSSANSSPATSKLWLRVKWPWRLFLEKTESHLIDVGLLLTPLVGHTPWQRRISLILEILASLTAGRGHPCMASCRVQSTPLSGGTCYQVLPKKLVCFLRMDWYTCSLVVRGWWRVVAIVVVGWWSRVEG